MHSHDKPHRIILLLGLVLWLATASWLPVEAAPVAQEGFACTDVSEIPQSECQALVALYVSTNGPGWLHQTGWLATNTPCHWDGVDCQDGHVHILDLPGNQLSRWIPPQLANLSRVNYLDLSYNALMATDPALLEFLAQKAPEWETTQTVAPTSVEGSVLTSDRITVSWTPIRYTRDGGYYEVSYATDPAGPFTVHGVTPDKVSNQYTLTGLAPDTRYFVRVRTYTPTHAFNPHELWSDYGSVAFVQGSYNCANVSEIPQSECQVLAAIYHSTNGPGWLGQGDWLATNTPCSWHGVGCQDGHVRTLELVDNYLSGRIPPELGNLANLQELFLSFNPLSGRIPPELGNLANLQQLRLYSNDLSGAIPPTLGDLTNLQELDLYGNDLSGRIPPELGNLANLQELDLSWNDLSGAIPPTLGDLTNLQELALNFTQLSGRIPPELGNLAKLYHLFLSDNDLSGAIPPELGNLAQLSRLSLRSNQLSEPIPPELRKLRHLSYLVLADNQLSGPIPPELGNLTSLQELHLDANQLSGPLPPQLIGLSGLSTLSLSYNALTATDPALLTFLARRQPRWAVTQTVPPTSVQALASDHIAVSWTPILYTGDGGYYEISYATDPAGPFTVHGVTSDKASNQYTLTGLAPDTRYFVRVRTYTPANTLNQNELWSDYSSVISVIEGASHTVYLPLIAQ